MIGPMHLKTIPGTYKWQVAEDYLVTVRGREFMIPSGFITDIASVPRLLQGLFPAAGKYRECAVLHDFLLSMKWPREFCDAMFFYMMVDNGIPRRYAVPMFIAVRMRSRGMA